MGLAVNTTSAGKGRMSRLRAIKLDIGALDLLPKAHPLPFIEVAKDRSLWNGDIGGPRVLILSSLRARLSAIMISRYPAIEAIAKQFVKGNLREFLERSECPFQDEVVSSERFSWPVV